MALFTTLVAPCPARPAYYMEALFYLDGQSVAENRSWGYTDIRAVAGGALYDTVAAGWGFDLTNRQYGDVSGVRQPDFSGGTFWLATGVAWSSLHDVNGDRSMYAQLSWDGTYPGGWFQSGFSGSKTITLPKITRGALDRRDASTWKMNGLDRADPAWKQQVLERYTGSDWARQV